ncbi:MAG: hypothetical protein M0P69_12530 [Bacteroidales bacterium]|nr:hypothetical protein [Bacteroidales bacterium]
MKTEQFNGHEIIFHNGKWIYADTKEVVSEDIPDSWLDRCSNNGYERYTDKNGNRRYEDTNELVSDIPFRPCARCGHYPNEDGDDFCIQRLGAVMNACCGHGNREGYIQFDNGITIRGYFRVEKEGE